MTKMKNGDTAVSSSFDLSSSSSSSSSVILPGDLIPSGNLNSKRLQKLEGRRLATRAAVAVERPIWPYEMTYYGTEKRYIPRRGHPVVGVITQKSSEYYKLDIRSPSDATLNTLAFERATKRNRPNLIVGSVVYCWIAAAHKDFETEVTCICGDMKKEWTSGETFYGELKDGFVFEVPISFAYSLVAENCYVLERLGKSLSFEIAVGLNGRVWIKCDDTKMIIVISNIIRNSFGRSIAHMEVMISRLLKEVEN